MDQQSPLVQKTETVPMALFADYLSEAQWLSEAQERYTPIDMTKSTSSPTNNGIGAAAEADTESEHVNADASREMTKKKEVVLRSLNDFGPIAGVPSQAPGPKPLFYAWGGW